MPLDAPRLDDRRFQDLVDEAKKRISIHCAEWTDHNVSDPGITLIELFAWMVEILIYRLNQVPDLHAVRFLEILGITLKGPEPAKTPVTFWLSAPQPNPVTIPAGTEVASTQTEAEPSIIFSTDSDLVVQPPQLVEVISLVAGKSGKTIQRQHNILSLENGFENFEVFSSLPQDGDALYFGFENDLSSHILGFKLDYDSAGGTGVRPDMPPYVWEASTEKPGEPWAACDVDIDTTWAMNRAGDIRIHLPAMGASPVEEKIRYWVRVRVIEITQALREAGMTPYIKSPRLRKASLATWGGTAAATHARVIRREFLGQSDGSPGQRLQLQHRPVLKREPSETLVVEQDQQPTQAWTEVPDFSTSQDGDQHFTLDEVAGEIRTGPAVRLQDGIVKLYGEVPRRGANLFFARYRSGGGQEGNVQAGILNTLKTSIPYITRVSNRQPAEGGLDAETLESARMRAPAMLRSRERAVTEDDFEFLARDAFRSAIGRVKCLQPRPGDSRQAGPRQIYLLVIPSFPEPEKRLPNERLTSLDSQLVADLAAYLDERRLLTTRLEIGPPTYHWVTVKVRLQAAPGAAKPQVEDEVLARLYRFLNPLTGGPNGSGWEFGRHLFVSDIYPCLQGIPNVQFVRKVELFEALPGGKVKGEPVESVEPVTHGVIASGEHEVVVD